MRIEVDNNLSSHLSIASEKWMVLFGLFLILSNMPVHAGVEFEWNGFGTIGAGILNDDSINKANTVPHNGYDEDWQVDVDSRLGFQGTARFSQNASATLQLLADSADDEDIVVEWAYISYDFSDKVRLRAGRMRKPLYENSDFLRVGYAYHWARPPVEVYSRDTQVYDDINAVDLLWFSSVGQWDLVTQLYFGGFNGETKSLTRGQVLDYETRGDTGIAVELEKESWSLRLGYRRTSDVTVETADEQQMLFDGLSAAGFDNLVEDMEIDGISAEFFNLGFSYDDSDWLFATEYVFVPIDGGRSPDETSWYMTAGRRYNEWTFHLTYGERQREVDGNFAQPILDQAAFVGPPFNAGLLALADGVEKAEQSLIVDFHSYTLGARYDFDKPICIKVEYQYIVDDQFDLTNNLFSVVVDFLF